MAIKDPTVGLVNGLSYPAGKELHRHQDFWASHVTSDKGPMPSCLMIITCHPLMAEGPAGAAHFHNLIRCLGQGGSKLPGRPSVGNGKTQGPASLGLLQTLAQPGSLYPTV